MKLLIGLGFKLGFVSFVFHFPVPRGARFPLFPFLVLVTSYQKLKFSNCTSMNYSHI